MLRRFLPTVIAAAAVLAVGAVLPIPRASAAGVDRSPRPARVLSVGDGDTIRVQQGSQRVIVRLACIDSPELRQSPHGAQARALLRQLLPVGTSVVLHPQAIDRYSRTVAEVVTTQGVVVNQAMVEQGQAFVFRRYLRAGCDAGRYLLLERQAEAARLGVWVVHGGSPRPWEFRRLRRRQQVPADLR
jgi:endonuclease YncB( thermonuclease family)